MKKSSSLANNAYAMCCDNLAGCVVTPPLVASDTKPRTLEGSA